MNLLLSGKLPLSFFEKSVELNFIARDNPRYIREKREEFE